jgi:outer membrane protein OmpA-like peptidoglycan-associated protein
MSGWPLIIWGNNGFAVLQLAKFCHRMACNLQNNGSSAVRHSNLLLLLAIVSFLPACDYSRRAEANKGVPVMGETSSVEIQTSDITPLPPRSAGSAPVMPDYGAGLRTVQQGDVTLYPLDSGAQGAYPTAQTGYGTGGYAMTPAPSPYSQPHALNRAYQNYQHSGGMNAAPAQYARSGSGETQIFFRYGSSRLGSIDKQKIASAADSARFAPVSKVTVEGFASRPTQAGTNSVEAHVLNLKESMNRSFAVSKEMLRNGVPAEKIKTVSWGAAKATGDDSYDRRVDISMGER